MRGVDYSVPHEGGGSRRSALGFAQGGTVNANGVTLMAQSTEKGFDKGFVAEKRLPFRVI